MNRNSSRPRRVLLIAINYWPELTGIGKYTGEMAEWLAGRGFQVRVITAPPYYPSWCIGPGYSGLRYRHENAAGVDIWRCPLWVPARPSGMKRILHLASFALSAMPLILWHSWRWRPDTVFVVEPPLLCAPATLLAARISGAQAWLHVQDFEIDAAFEIGLLHSERLRWWAINLERWLMRKFDRVSTISERMLECLEKKDIALEKRMLFPNWVELDRIKPNTGISPLRKEWMLAETDVVVLYSGNMGEKQGLEVLIDAAHKLVNLPNIRIILCGDGAARSRLEQLARESPNIEIKPLQPAERLNDLLNLADVHVLPQRSDAADLVLPSKLTNMLASGRPVVATAVPGTQIADILQNCGVVVNPEDSVALAKAVSTLSVDREKRVFMGANARKLAERLWDKERLLSQAFLDQANNA